MLIFAYGSNMCSKRLLARVPSAKSRGKAALDGFVLRFHKKSIDGSSKADAFRTGTVQDVLWGVVFEIDENEKPALNRAEGLNAGYREDVVSVRVGGTTLQAQIYLAEAEAISPHLKPYTWYVRYVLAGALEHGLPDPHVEMIRAIEAVVDPDSERHTREWIELE